MESEKVIKNKKGVSDWKIVFNDNSYLSLSMIVDEMIIYSRDKITICLTNLGYIDEIKEKFLKKEIKKIVQLSYIEGFNAIFCDKTFEYNDMELIKITNTGKCDNYSAFNIVFKSK